MLGFPRLEHGALYPRGDQTSGKYLNDNDDPFQPHPTGPGRAWSGGNAAGSGTGKVPRPAVRKREVVKYLLQHANRYECLNALG
ncbi:hypothetical protein ACFB49_33580 [Sphingomonas sp. DBB INV C78]